MRTLINDPFENDAVSILEWGYGADAKRSFVEAVANGQRSGQAFMNTLFVFDRIEYEKIATTVFDPFYDDNKLLSAIELLTTKTPAGQHFAYHSKDNKFTHRTACGCSQGENHWLPDGE